MPPAEQAKPVQLAGTFFCRGQQVDAGRLDAAVSQHIRQTHHVPAGGVERPGEQPRFPLVRDIVLGQQTEDIRGFLAVLVVFHSDTVTDLLIVLVIGQH